MLLTYEILTNAGIVVYQVADSEMSVTFLVSESEVERAVQLLHERLFEQ
jgi:aspartokinase